MNNAFLSVKMLEHQYSIADYSSIGSFISSVHQFADDINTNQEELLTCLKSLSSDADLRCRDICKNHNLSEEQRLEATAAMMVIASYMLVLLKNKKHSCLSKVALMFMEHLSRLYSSYDYTRILPSVLNLEMEDCGFSWTVLEAPGVDVGIIAYQFLNTCSFSSKPLNSSVLSLNKSGSVTLFDNRIVIVNSKDSNLVPAFNVCGGFIQVLTRNSREDKLKASKSEDIDSLDGFIRTYMSAQKKYPSSGVSKINQELNVGDKCSIVITDIVLSVNTEPISCVVLGGFSPSTGKIKNEELFKGVFVYELKPYLYDNDCIVGARLIDKDKKVFSICDSYRSYCKEKVTEDIRNHQVVEGIVIKVQAKYDTVIWITVNGYPVITKGADIFNKGDQCMLEPTQCVENVQGFFIYGGIKNTDIPQNAIQFGEDKDNVLEDFVKDIDTVKESFIEETKSLEKDSADELVYRISSVLTFSSSDNSFERYRRMLTAMLITNASGNVELLSEIQRKALMLKYALSFAQHKPVMQIPSDINLNNDEIDTLTCLRLMNQPDGLENAYSLLAHPLSQTNKILAQLVLGQCVSHMNPDEVSVEPEVIRRRVCRLLGVQDQFKSEVSRLVYGKYGLGENDNVEFKASYVMRNDGRGADLDYQGRGQVFEAVCGFLNKNGGTLYIGVDNLTGNPIKDPQHGIKGDMKWLQDNYDRVSRIRYKQLGHPVPLVKDLDMFCLFLNDERELYFSQTLQKNITIVPTDDQDAIRISVKPAEYEIAVLYKDKTHSEGTAYIRDGNETRPMTRREQEQRLMDLKSISKSIDFILILNEAIDKKHKVILKNYYSGTRNAVSDKLIVPINLVYNDENVYAYDLEEKAFREFRLSRVEDIITDIENPTYPHSFLKMGADVFRWIDTGREHYHIKVRIGVKARNYLYEEYSNTKNIPIEELYPDPDHKNKWILDTTLFGLGAIARFYLGLADDIELLDTEDTEALKQYIEKFINENLVN